MSEFQYLEFSSIDRSLTSSEIDEISSWSSRSQVSGRRAIFTYSYADFPKDEEKVLVKYFDAFFYLANWGTTRLMFKLPKESSNYKKIKSYGIKVVDSFVNGMKVHAKSKYVVVDISFGEEDDFGWIDENQSWLSELQELRNDIMKGDYRALFLIWLHGIHLKYIYEDIDINFEIPKEKIPPNLKNLNARLESLIKLFGMDKDWVNAAAMYSEDVNKRPNYALISKLPTSVKEEYLVKILKGEINLATKLQLELDKVGGKGSGLKSASESKSEVIRLEELLYKVEEAKGKEIEERKKADRRKYLQKMKKLKKNEKEIRDRIDENIVRGTGKSYDAALQDILDIKEFFSYNKEEKEFNKFIKKIRKKCSAKPAMLRRLESNKLM